MTPARVVFFGASSVHGRNDPQGGGFVGRFRAWHEAKSSRNLCYNLGIAGELLASMCERFVPEVSCRKADLTILSLGYNDIHREVSSESAMVTSFDQYETQVEKLLSAAKGVSKLLYVTQLPFDEARTMPLPRTNWHYRASDGEKIVNIGRQIAIKHQIPILDLYTRWQISDWLPMLSEDGMHPNAFGHQNIFEVLRESIAGSAKIQLRI
jgi:lysophospholipase L1-like esterase